MSLQRRRERYSIIMIFKILHKITPNDLGLSFTTSERRGIRVTVPKIHKDAKAKYTTMYDNSFPVRGAMLWNRLPAHVTTKTSMESFKSGLTRFLQSFPDHPPIQGQSSRNSLLELNLTDRDERGCCRINLQ